MASTTAYDQLLADLQKPQFKARTEEELAAAAAAQYGSLYDQKTLAAQQAYDQSALALDQQSAALDPVYQRQIQEAQQATEKSVVNADNAALARGMGRSSYALATRANIDTAGTKLQNDIMTELSQAKGNLNSQKSLAQQQLAQLLSQYSTSKASDMASYVDQQRQSDLENALNYANYNNELLLKLYALQPKTSSSSSGGSKQSKWVINGVDYKNEKAYKAEQQKQKDIKDTKLANILKPNGYGQAIVTNGVLSYLNGR